MIGLTYRNREDEQGDRAQQAKLLAALDAAPSQLRRDECGWWVISGRRYGTIQTWGDGATWVAYVTCRSARHWAASKRRLGFMTVTQDGDEEGCLRLLHLPTPEEATRIREVLGLKKRRHLSEDHREALIAAGSKHRFRAGRPAVAPRRASLLPPDTNGPRAPRKAPPDPGEKDLGQGGPQ